MAVYFGPVVTRSISLLALLLAIECGFVRPQESTAATPSIQVRLIDGPDSHQGIPQFYHLQVNDWVDICVDAIQKVDADVVCKTLGFHGADVIRIVTRSPPGPDFTALPFVWCDTTNDDFKDCQMSGLQTNATDCKENAPEITCLTTRLYGGSKMSSGRVEVWSAGRWGKVCSPDFGEEEQTVACRELGYARRSEIDFATSQFSDPGNIMYAWGDVSCEGTEQKLSECGPETPPPSTCPEEGEAHASCTNSDTGEETPPYFAVELEDGPCEMEGRLMVWGGPSFEWSTVCQEMITEQDARVICRQLGFESSAPRVVRCCDTYPSASAGTRKVLDALNCTGDEPMIDRCPHPPPGHLAHCASLGHHDNDVGIQCRPCPAKSSNIGTIVGVVIGVLIIIIIVIAVVVYFRWYRPQRMYREKVDDVNERDFDDDVEGGARTQERMLEKDLEETDLDVKTADPDVKTADGAGQEDATQDSGV